MSSSPLAVGGLRRRGYAAGMGRADSRGRGKQSRRPRHRAPEAGPPDSEEGFPSWEHNSFTFEGEIERLGAIGRNMSNAPRWARFTAKFVVLSMLAVFAVGVIQFLVHVVG